MLGFVFRIQQTGRAEFTVRKVADCLPQAIEKLTQDGYTLLSVVSMQMSIMKTTPSIYAADIERYMTLSPEATREQVLAWAVDRLPGLTRENIATYAAADDFWPKKKA